MSASNPLQSKLIQLRQLLKPPPKLKLSEWAVKNFKLSPEASAESGSYSEVAPIVWTGNPVG